MQVSEVRLNLLNSNTAVKAIGSFALDDSFAVRGVRVMEDKHGHNFVAFPSREKQDGSYEDIAFPLSKELYATITGAVLEEYKQQVEKQEQKSRTELIAVHHDKTGFKATPSKNKDCQHVERKRGI